MLHKAKKAYYACDVIRFLVPYAERNRLAARTGCAVHPPCLLAVRQLPWRGHVTASPIPLPSIERLAARTVCAVHFSLFSRVTLTDEVSGQA